MFGVVGAILATCQARLRLGKRAGWRENIERITGECLDLYANSAPTAIDHPNLPPSAGACSANAWLGGLRSRNQRNARAMPETDRTTKVNPGMLFALRTNCDSWN